MKSPTPQPECAVSGTEPHPSPPRLLSVVVPIYNERENLEPLHEATVRALEGIGETFEILLVNDGSKDGSNAVIDAIATGDPRVHAVHLGRNSGQTAAIMAGVHLARGEVIVIMDADLQNDPKDIRKLLKEIDAGYDVCSGWRKNRKDHPIKRNLPSRAANWLISKISGVHLHDYGCSLKAYRADILKNIDLYGEMHRFIPIYAKLLGARVTETVVSHRSRAHGSSKYGLERVGKVLLDLIVVKFLMKYSQKPMHIFGSFGLLCLLCSLFSFGIMLYLKFFDNMAFIVTPLPLLSVLFAMIGVNAIFMGLIAEMLMRTWYESQNKKTYHIVRLTSRTLRLD